MKSIFKGFFVTFLLVFLMQTEGYAQKRKQVLLPITYEDLLIYISLPEEKSKDLQIDNKKVNVRNFYLTALFTEGRDLYTRLVSAGRKPDQEKLIRNHTIELEMIPEALSFGASTKLIEVFKDKVFQAQLNQTTEQLKKHCSGFYDSDNRAYDSWLMARNESRKRQNIFYIILDKNKIDPNLVEIKSAKLILSASYAVERDRVSSVLKVSDGLWVNFNTDSELHSQNPKQLTATLTRLVQEKAAETISQCDLEFHPEWINPIPRAKHSRAKR